MSSKKARRFNDLRTKYLEQGEEAAPGSAGGRREETQNLPRGDVERLYGWLEGSGKKILVEPDALLTESSRLPGLDGQKMSKSYGNDLSLREDAASVTTKIRTTPTEPARVKRTDPGNPEHTPGWQLRPGNPGAEGRRGHGPRPRAGPWPARDSCRAECPWRARSPGVVHESGQSRCRSR